MSEIQSFTALSGPSGPIQPWTDGLLNNALGALLCNIGMQTTAVVLIEYQNDFTSPGGVLHEAVKGVMQSTSMLDKTVETVNAARAKGALIIHSPITFSDDYRELGENVYGILAK